MNTQAPAWFTRALAVPYDERTISVAGVPVHYLCWGRDSGKPGLVFVHGNGAHAHWWTFLAPFSSLIIQSPPSTFPVPVTAVGANTTRRSSLPKK